MWVFCMCSGLVLYEFYVKGFCLCLKGNSAEFHSLMFFITNYFTVLGMFNVDARIPSIIIWCHANFS